MRTPLDFARVLAGCLLVVPLTVVSCGDDDEGPSGSECQVDGQDCRAGCSSELGCVQCKEDGDCAGALGACWGGRCRACADNADCAAGQACYPRRGECGPACTPGSCGDPEPLCDVATGACVECLANTDCDTDQPICNPYTKQCGECGGHADCPAGQPMCDVLDGDCEECLVDADCPSGTRCNNDHECRFSCGRNEDCTDAERPVCNVESGSCVQCLANEHCPAATAPICVDRRCEQCAVNGDCPTATPICRDRECVECVEDADCIADPARTNCDNRVCVAP